jgi:pimeloyl-ACP methyl ester carboxylesterase
MTTLSSIQALSIETSAGTIEYGDTGGPDPVVVFLHGVFMDASVWRNVVPQLRADYRCITPTLPLGAHRRPMHEDADLSFQGQARLVAELLERLELREVTLVGNDWGGAQLLISLGLEKRLARLVLCSCEAFDNYPPGLPGRSLLLASKVPGGLTALAQPLRIRPLRRLPVTFGWMSKRPVPDQVMDVWLGPMLSQRLIRRDLLKYVRSRPSKAVLLGWAERQRSFDRPVLVVWASEDRIMPREHGKRLAQLFPNSRLVEIADSYTLIPEDQPLQLASAIRQFLQATPLPARFSDAHTIPGPQT